MVIPIKRSITITGTRQIINGEKLKLIKVFDQIFPMWNTETTTWLVGGADGVDTHALVWLLENTFGKINIVVPHTVVNQPIKARTIIENARSFPNVTITELKHYSFPSSDSFHDRNHYMVDRSHLVLGFPHAFKRSSGTNQTLKYAADNNVPLFRIPVGVWEDI